MAALASSPYTTMDSSRQRTSPANDPASIQQQQQQQHLQQQHLLHQQQQQQIQMLQQQQQGQYPYTVQQQPQGTWTPNITATPFYPSFYQNQQAQGPPQPYPTQAPYFDPANAQQLAAQWAYQQMMFSAQHGFPQQHPQQRPSPASANPSTPDYFTQNQIFNPFPSGTPPPRPDQQLPQQQQQQQQYPAAGAQFHPYRRPNRAQHQQSSPPPDDQRRQGLGQAPHPPYARPDASGSSSSINSSSSHHHQHPHQNQQRQRTNSNQSASSGHHGPSSLRSASGGSTRPSLSAVAASASAAAGGSSLSSSPTSTSASSPLRQPLPPPHTRSGSSSSASTATSSSRGFSPSSAGAQPTLATSPPAASSSSSPLSPSQASGSLPRLTRPSPLSQGSSYSAAEKRRSRDDSDIAALIHEQTPTAAIVRSGGLKGRLRRALSFNAAQTLKEEEDAVHNTVYEEDEEQEDDDESIKASQVNGKLKAKAGAGAPPIKVNPLAKTPGGGEDEAGPSTAPVKKKGRAASLFNSRLNASTDNISLSSTVSSASVMIRKLGAMGKLARRNSLAGITSLFKDKDKDKEGKDGEGKDKKGKKKEKESKKTAKGQASEASVSHVTAELDRMGAGGDWSVGNEMNGLSPAAKLARQHTLKSNAEAAAKAKEAVAREAAAKEAVEKEAAARGAGQGPVFMNGANGSGSGAGVPTWDRNTATRQGSVSPVKGGTGVHRINEDGTRTLIESDDEESDDGHYPSHGQQQQQQQQHQSHYQHQQHQQQGFHADGWDDDEEWDVDGDDNDPDGDGDGDEDVTIRLSVDQRSSADTERTTAPGTGEMEPWAVDVRRSIEKARQPAKGILKRAESYDQQVYLVHDPHAQRARSNSYNSPASQQQEAGPLARIPSPDPDHIDGLHRHGSHSSGHSSTHGHGQQEREKEQQQQQAAPWLPPLSFDSVSSPLSSSFPGSTSKDLPETPKAANTTFASAITASPTSGSSLSSSSSSSSSSIASPQPILAVPENNRASAIYQQPNLNSSAPALTTVGTGLSGSSMHPPTLAHRSATTPAKRLTFATNLSVYDTFSASVYDRRSEPATWSRLTPALAQRIKEELNSYKMEEMEVHAASRIHTQFFV